MGQTLKKKRHISIPFWFQHKCKDEVLREKVITGSTAAVGSTVLMFVTNGIDLSALSWSITSCGGGRGLVCGPPTISLLQGGSVSCSENFKLKSNIYW